MRSPRAFGAIGCATLDQLQLRPVQYAGGSTQWIVRHTPVAALGAEVFRFESERRRGQQTPRPAAGLRVDPCPAGDGPVTPQVPADLVPRARDGLHRFVEAPRCVKIQGAAQVERRDRAQGYLCFFLLIGRRMSDGEGDEEYGRT